MTSVLLTASGRVCRLFTQKNLVLRVDLFGAKCFIKFRLADGLKKQINICYKFKSSTELNLNWVHFTLYQPIFFYFRSKQK